MRRLCDHNVAAKYRRAFEREDWVTVSMEEDELSRGVSDEEIAAYADAHDRVVFTTDDDFYSEEIRHGLGVYSQVEDPRPDDVVRAMAAIDDAYAFDDEIVEMVPDGWV